MKLNDINFDVQVNNAVGDSSAFSIAMNAKAFKVLSSTLYKDKIGSIVRELSCNAYDAHVAAGKKEIPFEIHLPDNFEPWFSVKDFGVGLSDTDVKKIFCVYFESTKDQSNDAIGAFGLGAKTPFSYTDQFTVTSVYNGISTVYSAYIDGSGIPNITKMLEEETAEDNGVEIKMSVKTSDFFSFKHSTANQLKFFTVKPVVQNAGNFRFESTILENEVIFQSDDFSFFGHTGAAFVKMGQIGYSLDMHQIERESGIVIAFKAKNLGILFNTNIGDIGVTASRESIEYDKKTCVFLANKLNAIYEEIKTSYVKMLEDISTDWEKAIFYNDVIREMGVGESGDFPFMIRNRIAAFEVPKEYSNSVYSFYRAGNRYIRSHIEAYKNTVILLNTTKTFSSHVRQVLSGKYQNCYVVMVNKNEVGKAKEIFTKALGGFTEFVVSDDIIALKTKTAAPRTSTSFWKYNGMHDPNTWTKVVSQKTPSSFYYVILDNLKYNNKDESRIISGIDGAATIPEFKQFCTDIKNGTVPLLGFSKANESKAKKLGGISFIEKFNEIAKSVSKNKVRHYVIKSNLRDISHAMTNHIKYSILLTALSNVDAPVGRAIRKCTEYQVKNKQAPSAGVIRSIFGSQELKTNYDKVLMEEFQGLFTSTPILRLDHYNLATSLSVKELEALLKIQVQSESA